MSHKSTRQRDDEQRLAERAAEWVVLLPQATQAERAEFASWIRESPQHLQEFLCVSAVVRGLDGVDLQKLLPEDAAADANIIQLAPTARVNEADSSRLPVARPREARSRRWGIGLAASLGVGALIAGALVWKGDARTYNTDIGENRILHLEDGSILQLNAGSRAEVTFNTRVRAIRLARGEAMFKVARDPARPFRVYAGANVIQALGTAFDVLNRPTGTTVSVLEGVVQITSPSQPGGAVAGDVLQAGEETRIDTVGRIEQRSSIDTTRMAAWRNSRLDFRADRLDDIAAQFNRYNDTPRIVIQDDAAAGRRFSGVFDADDPHSLADFLREEGGLVVEDQGRKILVSSRNRGDPR